VFPGPKTSYMEANTQKDEEIGVLGPRQHSHAPGTHFREPEHMIRHLVHECRCLAPRNSLTCTWRMVLGAWCLFLVGQGAVL